MQLEQLQDREISLFSDVELDAEMPSDTDEFWDALVTSKSRESVPVNVSFLFLNFNFF